MIKIKRISTLPRVSEVQAMMFLEMSINEYLMKNNIGNDDILEIRTSVEKRHERCMNWYGTCYLTHKV